MYYQFTQSKETIFFRVDGDSGQKAGLGHIYRTLKIYRFLKNVFKNEYNFIFLMKNYKLGRELIHNETKEKIITYNSSLSKKLFNVNDIVIIDTLGVEKFFLKFLNKIGIKKIISFDELDLKNFRRGVIINGIYFAKKKITLYSKKISIYQGPKYLILNKYFYKKKRKLYCKNNKIKILVTSGGADNKNFLFKIVKLLNFYKKINCDIVVVAGKGVKKNNPIYGFRKLKNIKILNNVKNMKKIFDRVHMSIVSGGTVMFESICCGKVTLVCQTYPHQIFATRYFERKKIIENIGSINQLKQDVLNNYFKNFDKFKKNYKSLFLKRTKEIDGKGLLRVKKIICKYINDK